MAQNISTDQSKLSQYLQLLYQVHSSYPLVPSLDVPNLGSWDNRNKTQAKKIIRILDTIAVALTTGKPGEVFAVGLDKTCGIKLILAKNGPHTEEDDQAVCRLLDVIKNPEDGVVAKHVLPFLLSRCKENIKKRVKKMVEVLGECEAGMKEIGATYILSSEREKEFPRYEFYSETMGRPVDKDLPFADTMDKLRSDISEEAQTFLNHTKGPNGSGEEVVRSFMRLAMFAYVLEASPFLHSLCDTVKSEDYPTLKPDAERLRRRLAKVYQYYQGMHKLVEYAKRFPTQSLSYCWVSPITGTGETAVHLDEYVSVIAQILHPIPLPDDAAVRVQNHFPELERNWRSSRSIETCVHVEIRVLLHLDSSPHPPDHEQPRNWQPIGCSKRTCLCCTLWINAYNQSARAKWLTGSSRGKLYATWALPSPGHLHADDSTADGRCTADREVMRGVETRLQDLLDPLFRGEHDKSEDDAISRRIREDSIYLHPVL